VAQRKALAEAQDGLGVPRRPRPLLRPHPGEVRLLKLRGNHLDRFGTAGGSGAVEFDTAIGQLVNEAVAADEVVDIYKLAGIESPELSILSDEFLDSLIGKDKPNLQMGLLRRFIKDQIRTVQRTNVVQSRRFSEQLDEAINRYTNRALTTAEIVAELVKMAKEMKAQNDRHHKLGLSVAEAAFHDAVIQNDAAILQMGTRRSSKSPSTSSGLFSRAPPSTGPSWSPSAPPCDRRSADCSPSTATHPTSKSAPSSWSSNKRSCPPTTRRKQTGLSHLAWSAWW